MRRDQDACGAARAELAGGFNEYSQSRESANGRLHGRRIEPLLGRIDAHPLDQLVRERAEQRLVQTQFQDSAAVVPQSPLAQVRVRLVANVQGVVPGDIQSYRFDSLPVGQVVKLLQDHGAKRHVKVLAGAAEIPAERRREVLHRQVLKQRVAEHARPTLLKQFPPLRPKILPRIEQIPAPMVAYSSHRLDLAALTDPCKISGYFLPPRQF